eukprot:COSAG06_NODE_5969_length_3178_cov_21.326405_2_plen_225_part_00
MSVCARAVLLDRNESGALNPLELRASLMACSATGIITELTELQPLDQAYRPWQTIVTEGEEKGDDGQPKKKKFLNKASASSDNFDDFEKKNLVKHGGKQMYLDYPISVMDGTVVLLGNEGVGIGHRTDPAAWAMRIEFQYDPEWKDAQGDGTTNEYSVLVSSYRQNAIIAKVLRMDDTKWTHIQFFVRCIRRKPASTALCVLHVHRMCLLLCVVCTQNLLREPG